MRSYIFFSTITIQLLAIIFLSFFHLSNSYEDAYRMSPINFDASHCSSKPYLELSSDSSNRRNLTGQLNLTDNDDNIRILYFTKPTKIKMECTARYPIEIQVDREMVCPTL